MQLSGQQTRAFHFSADTNPRLLQTAVSQALKGFFASRPKEHRCTPTSNVQEKQANKQIKMKKNEKIFYWNLGEKSIRTETSLDPIKEKEMKK